MVAIWILIIVIVSFVSFKIGAWSLAILMRMKFEQANNEMEIYLDELEKHESDDYILGSLESTVKFAKVIDKSFKSKNRRDYHGSSKEGSKKT